MTGERIKQLREQNGYTQTSLANELGLSRSAINAWEMGISIPSTQCLVELSVIFKVSVDYLLDVSTTETIDVSNLTSEEKTVIYTLLNYFRKHREIMAIIESEEMSPIETVYQAQTMRKKKIKKIIDD